MVKRDEVAFASLREDHAHIAGLLGDYRGATTVQKDTVFEKIKHELDAHAVVMEEVFYPRIEASLEPALLEAARDEHRAMRALLGEIAHTQPHDPRYDTRMERLRVMVERHASVEEGEVLPRAASALGPDAVRALEEEMASRKRGVLEEMAYP